ncbi:DUF6771 family protein [Sphingomonas adhaesiva]|uniref:DUF6771 family protein n=1 Tax=Sphingomonas adhaesiva TaxID=28212 RepID=UPI002FFC9C95
MELLDPQQIARALLLDSAGWARIGLTAPVLRLREQAAQELAMTICRRLVPPAPVDTDQLPLPL